MPDFGSEVMAEALAQRALVKPVYTIPIIPLSNSNQYRHQDHLDMKDYKKVSSSLHTGFLPIMSATGWKRIFIRSCSSGAWVLEQNVCRSLENVIDLTFVLQSVHTVTGAEVGAV